MPAKDFIHYPVKAALVKEGWTITHDPYVLRYEDDAVYTDLGAERPIAAERTGQKIAVEIKSFTGKSTLHDFRNALGQFVLYRTVMATVDPQRKLYLAVSQPVYENTFQRPMIQLTFQHNALSLLVINLETEEVVQWIN